MDSRTKFNLTMPPNDLRSPILSPKEPPPCVQNAMFKERKPFTYTPGGLDLSEIRSEKMAKRLMRNAMSPGVQERPKPPNFTPTDPSAPKSSHYFNLPIAVFPCVQIPPNPKELLRRTSGPFSRSESMESPKLESPTVNGHSKKEELSKGDKIKTKKTKSLNKTTYEETSKNKIKHENKLTRQESRVNKIKSEEISSVESFAKIKCEEVKSNTYKSEEIDINNVAYEEVKTHISSANFSSKNNTTYEEIEQKQISEDVTYEEVKSQQISSNDIIINTNNVTHEEVKSKQAATDEIFVKKSNGTCEELQSKQISSDIFTNNNNVTYEESENFSSKTLEQSNMNNLTYQEEKSKQTSSNDIFIIKNNIVNEELNSKQTSSDDTLTNTSNMVYAEFNLKSTSNDVLFNKYDEDQDEVKTETFVIKLKSEENVNKTQCEEKSAVEIKNKFIYEAVMENINNKEINGFDVESEDVSNVNNIKRCDLNVESEEDVSNVNSSLREEQFNNIEEIIRIENNEIEKIELEISAEEEKVIEIRAEINLKDEVNFKVNENFITTKNSAEELNQFETSAKADDLCINEGEKEQVEIEAQDRVVSPVKRNVEAIKGLSNDLDNLPSLNICTKRFSFLRESPDIDDEDDPFRIITGIPPKISLIDRVDNKRNCSEKKVEDKIIKTDSKDTTGKGVDSFVSLLKEGLRSCSPYAKDDNNWKKDCLTVKDILEDPEPAWKIEMREISLRKAEAKEESPVKEFDSIPRKEVITPTQSPYQTWNNFTLKSDKEKSPSSYLPTWSQTLRPKSWKDRNTDRSELPEWKKPVLDTYVNKFARNQTEVRKTPEITVEVVNQPYATTTSLPSNGYVYPWESSPESSVAFSPEPRTPTPQSRNSPFSLSVNSPSAYGNSHPAVISREYGTLGYQPNRTRSNNNRSCPIQSRSFKYLQLLTGTYENYEDDEPFIPQPAQHAYPRPGNF